MIGGNIQLYDGGYVCMRYGGKKGRVGRLERFFDAFSNQIQPIDTFFFYFFHLSNGGRAAKGRKGMDEWMDG